LLPLYSFAIQIFNKNVLIVTEYYTKSVLLSSHSPDTILWAAVALSNSRPIFYQLTPYERGKTRIIFAIRKKQNNVPFPPYLKSKSAYYFRHTLRILETAS